MKRWWYRLLATLGGFVVVFLLYLNIRLYDTPQCFTLVGGRTLNEDVFQQLRYLKRVIHEDHAAEDMQILYPEGFVFMHALYALAWCDILKDLPPDGMYWQEGMHCS